MGRFEDLEAEEVGDLFRCVHRVAPVIKREFAGTSLTISVQVLYQLSCRLLTCAVRVMPVSLTRVYTTLLQCVLTPHTSMITTLGQN